MYEDVLIATDGSDIAANAATVGLSLAQTLDASVFALSIAEQGRDTVSRHSKGEANANALVTVAANAGCDADPIVREGRPATEILATADDTDADLLVLGTHGRTGLKQLLVGSVALEVICEARQPVLSVSPAVAWDDDRSIDDILLATDGWTGSAAATEHAISLADACEASLHSLYAVDIGSDPPEHQEAFEEHGEQTTRAVANRAGERGVTTTQTVTSGPADEVVLEYAATRDVDLVVMGTESKTNLEGLVIGSVSQRVIPNAPVPVITVRTIDQ